MIRMKKKKEAIHSLSLKIHNNLKLGKGIEMLEKKRKIVKTDK
jgi:hypothetical protein